MTDWYERRDELDPGQVFRTHDDSIVRLDQRVPGDGTDWYCDVWIESQRPYWSAEMFRLHPSDLKDRLADNYPNAR